MLPCCLYIHYMQEALASMTYGCSPSHLWLQAGGAGHRARGPPLGSELQGLLRRIQPAAGPVPRLRVRRHSGQGTGRLRHRSHARRQWRAAFTLAHGHAALGRGHALGRARWAALFRRLELQEHLPSRQPLGGVENRSRILAGQRVGKCTRCAYLGPVLSPA